MTGQVQGWVISPPPLKQIEHFPPFSTLFQQNGRVDTNCFCKIIAKIQIS